MKRVLNRMGLITLIFTSAIILLIIVSYANHKIHLFKENKLFLPKGQLVEVNGHNIHVYTEGKGDIPLVFMSGGETSSPVLDFKSLYSLLRDKYKIVVVERSGYGFSDIGNADRDIDNLLYETREALLKAEINGPYILLPHSMSGIEALYWGQSYPEEVLAIVGLDMAVPESYEDFNINMPIVKLSAFAADIGIIRWIPGLAESDAIKYGTLTEDEKDLYRIVFYRRTATRPMLKELEEIKTNASKVREGGVVSIPILMFSSNGEGTGWDESIWKSHQENYMEKVKDGGIINLNCPHYIHDIEYDKIANEIDDFIESLN